MKKYICDLCGLDSDDTDYSLPVWIHVCGGRGNLIISPKFGIETDVYNLCNKCKQELADFLYDKQKNKNKKETV